MAKKMKFAKPKFSAGMNVSYVGLALDAEDKVVKLPARNGTVVRRLEEDFFLVKFDDTNSEEPCFEGCLEKT